MMNPIYKNTVIFVKDIERSKKFYISILSQKIEYDFGSNIIFKSGISLWELREYLPISKMLGKDRLKDDNNNKFELYFEDDNLENIELELTKSGIHFLHHVHEEPWGQKTIRFFDPDEHLIEIGESMQSFITRFFKNGMTVEQISKKTSVPKEVIKEIISKN